MRHVGRGARIALALTVVAALSFSQGATRALPAAPLSSLQRIIDDRVALPGTGIIVAELGPHGVAVLRAGSSGTVRPLGEHSIFEIGSLTKTLTATLLASMVLDGTVKLDDPLAKYLPKSVRVPTRGGKQITLLQLATHRSGLPPLPGNLVWSEQGFARYSVSNLYEFVSSYRLSRNPGTAFEYSSTGISLLGQALANRAGTTYAELLRKRVLAPLGMRDTAVTTTTPDQLARFTVGRDAADKVVPRLVFGGGLEPATMVHSSLADLVKFARCNLGEGPLAAACILAQQPRDDCVQGDRVGLVWIVEPQDGIVRHAGNTRGYHVAIAIATDHTRATVALENGDAPVLDIARHTIDPDLALTPASKPSLQAILDERTTMPSTGIIAARLTAGQVVELKSGSTGTSRPLDEHSIFEIGSVTKTFTATLLALMVLDGSVKLDDPVAMYLPRSVHVPARNGKLITLLSLATQHSGLPVLPSDPAGFSSKNPFAPTLSDMYDFVSHYKLERDPGAEYEYSNLGIALLGQALAGRAGTTYPELLRRRILMPLGMNDTSLVPTADQIKRLAIGRDAKDRIPAPWTFGALAPAGEIRSSLDDMIKFARCNMGQGPLARACLFAQIPRDDMRENRIGLTWRMNLSDGAVHHPGNVPGYHAAVAISAGHAAAAIVLETGALPVDDVAMHALDERVPVAGLSSDP
jgi:CubicO group peptidase (beta-lactamase class C family)